MTNNPTDHDLEKHLREKYEYFFHNAPIAYQSLDENGNIIDVNEAWLKVLGYKRTEVIGKPFADFLPPEWQEHFRKNFPRFKAMGEVMGVEFELIKKNGEKIYVAFDGSISRNEDGKFQQTHCIFQDTTHTKQTEAAYQKSEETARALLNASIESAFLIEPDGTFITLNEITAKCLGKTVDNLIGKCCWDYIPVELAESRKKITAQVVREKKPLRMTDKRSGSTFYNHVYPIIDADGNVTTVAVFSRDITEQNLAQETLRQSEEKFRHLAENSQDLIYRYDFIPEKRFTYVSPSATKITGYSPEEHYADPDLGFKLVHPDDRHMILSQMDEKTNLEDPVVFRWKKKDGTIIWTEQINRHILDHDGNLTAIEGIARDISERKLAEQALLESEEKYRSIFHDSNDAIFIHDLNGNILEVNSKVLDLFQYSENEILKIKVPALHPPHELEKSKQAFETVTKEGNVHVEMNFIKKDGTVFPVDLSSTLLNLSGQKIVQGIVRDISDRRNTEKRTIQLNQLNEKLLELSTINEKLNQITDCIVETFYADFARIWMVNQGDLCDSDCDHANVTEGPHVCRYRDKCLHLIASSGRYTHLDGKHQRVPFGCYKIGRVAAGTDPKFLTNDVINDNRIHDRQWAQKLGLVSFAGYRLVSNSGDVIGVLALFSTNKVTPEEDALFEHIANNTAQLIQVYNAEQELRNHKERLQLITDFSADVIYKLDLQTEQYTYASPSVERIFGYTVEEALKLKAKDIMTAESYEIQKEILAKALEKPSTETQMLQMDIIHKSGHPVPIEIHSGFLFDDLGNPKEILGIARDITERIKAEKALRESERRYHTLVDTAPSIILHLSPTGEILDLNPEAENFYGISRKEGIGLNYLERFIPDEFRPLVYQDIERVLNGHKTQDFENPVIDSNGEKRILSWDVAALLDDSNKPQSVICVGHDITDRKDAENMIKKSLKEKDVLLKEIHHRVKNNLAVIISLLNLQAGQTEDEQVIAALEDSRDRINSISMIHETLYGSENLAEIGLDDYTRNLGNRLLNVMQGMGIQVQMIYEIEDIHLAIDQAIPCGLILNELLTNALKYAFPEGRGVIRISAKLLASNEIELMVCDNGIGLPKEIQVNQLESLGLRLVSVLAEGQLDGTLDIRDQNGACFIIRWPSINNQTNEV